MLFVLFNKIRLTIIILLILTVRLLILTFHYIINFKT